MAICHCDDPKDVHFETCTNDIVAMMPIMMKVMVTLLTIWDIIAIDDSLITGIKCC